MDADTPKSSSATASQIWRPDEEEAAASLLILSMGAAAYRLKRKDVEHRDNGGRKLKKLRTEAIAPDFSECTKLLCRYDHTDLGSADNEVRIQMLLKGIEFEKEVENGDVSRSVCGETVSETREVVKLGYPDTRDHSRKTMTSALGSEKSYDSPRKEYKCKNCNRAFPSHQALGGHCAHPGKRACSALLKDVEICEDSHGKGAKAVVAHKSAQLVQVEVEVGGYAAKAKKDIPEKLEISADLTRLIDLNVPFELQEGEDGAHHLLKRCLVREHEHGPLVGPPVV